MTGRTSGSPLSSIEKGLGMSAEITRRDVVSGMAVAAGTALLAGCTDSSRAPVESASAAFNGYGGVGDFRNSNGNVWSTISASHQVRDNAISPAIIARAPASENYDLVIVGGGAAGLSAAYYFQSQTAGRRKCLILDNHPVFGGEAKQNEFEVDGIKLIGPQGSNELIRPLATNDEFLFDEFSDLQVPRDFSYVQQTGGRPLEFDRTNFNYLWQADHSDSVGLFLNDDVWGHSRRWLNNPWANELRLPGIPEGLRTQLLRWRHALSAPSVPGDFDRYLDTLTYRQFLMKDHRLPQEVADFVEPIIASAVGFGSSTVSAFTAVRILGLPGGEGPGARNYPNLTSIFETGQGAPPGNQTIGFPGGNATFARAFVKRLVPAAFSSQRFDGYAFDPIHFDELDRPGNATRIRLSSVGLDVKHVGPGGDGAGVETSYLHEGQVRKVRSAAVVVAAGGWIAKRIARDMPAALAQAYSSFHYAPVLVANVALTNWRFMERLGLTACIYTGGEFGFSCNIRRPMALGSFTPPLHPDAPAILTFYAPPTRPGLAAADQGAQLRGEVLSTPFREYERRIRSQLTTLFGEAGFSADRDVAGIVLNRWGHAYLVPEPGFHFGRNGNPPAVDVIRAGYGRIRFASAELGPLQTFRNAVHQAKRAIQQLDRFL